VTRKGVQFVDISRTSDSVLESKISELETNIIKRSSVELYRDIIEFKTGHQP
jgi:hypothetical protein